MAPEGIDRRRSNSPPPTSPRSFYKIIVPSIMSDHKLSIPEDFAKIYENELSTFAMLTVPSGQAWRVGVEKANKTIWLNDGWKEFAQHHSITCGFFLVFNYEGNSNFYVLIFDLTASEIHNPRNSLSFSEEPNHEKQCPASDEGKRRDDFVETLCYSVPRPGQVSSEYKNFDEFLSQRIGRLCKCSLVKKLSEFAPEFALRIHKHGFFTRNKRREMADEGKTVKFQNGTVSSNGKPKASEMPNSHGSPNKEKRNLTKSLENLQEDKKGYYLRKDSVMIRKATRRSEDIGSQFNDVKHTKSADELKLLSSDAANQRTDSNGQQLKVRQEDEEEVLLSIKNSTNFPTRQPVTTQDSGKAVVAATKFKPQNPFFMVILKLYNVHRSFLLHIPVRFAKKYLHRVPKFIKLQVSGEKQWTVSTFWRRRGQRFIVESLSKGWSVFVNDNLLLEGDVCVFELIEVEETALKVSIFRARETQDKPI